MSTATAGKVLLIPKGEYDATTQYKVLDWVLYQGRPYVAKQTTTGNAPIYAPTPQNPDAYWQLMLDFPTLVDNVPTDNSNNLVKSGGVYSAIATKQDTLTFDNAPTQNSNNPVKSGGVYSALQNVGHTIKDSTDTFTQRKNLVFDGFWVEDDSTNNATIIYKNNPLPLVSWSTGTDAEIKAMVDAYYAGDLTLEEIQSVWSIGDEREVTLSAMAATGVGESHVAQTVKFVLMNWGGKTLTDNTGCLAIVGQKNSLAESGYINSSNTNTGGWNSCARRSWCNNIYKAAIPSDFRELFKEHNNQSGTEDGSSSGTQTTADYFALPAEIEVFGSATSSAAGEGSQFKYYETSANRVKTLGEGGSASNWWERSPYLDSSNGFCYVTNSGGANVYIASHAYGLAPFGCI